MIDFSLHRRWLPSLCLITVGVTSAYARQDTDHTPAISIPWPAPPAATASDGATASPLTWHDTPTSGVTGRRLLRADDHPFFVTLAAGVTNSLDLPLYKDLGLNTLVVDAPWEQPQNYMFPDAIIQTATRIGLHVIVQVHAGQPPPALNLRVDSSDPDYVKAASTYLSSVGTHFRGMGGIVGIMTEDDAEQHVQVDNTGFRAFLGQRYPSLQALDQDWGCNFSNTSQVTMESAVDSSVRSYDGMSISGLLVGEYRADAYGSLQRFWASVLRERDPYHPIICGRQSSPRAAIQTPLACSGVVVGAAPPEVFPVDVGRRGGRFMTIVSLAPTDATRAEAIRPFLMQCLVHGAGGVAFPSWDSIAGDKQAQSGLRVLLRDLQSEATVIHDPANSCAVLYEPLAPGAPEGGPSAPFGYMPQPADQEPGLLIKTLSHGSMFGFEDVLSLADISADALTRYRVVFAPSAFIMPNAAVSALTQFVNDGGALVADLGMGLDSIHYLQNAWPAPMISLFGISATTPVQFATFEYPHQRSKLPLASAIWYPLAPRPDLLPDLTMSLIRGLTEKPVSFSGPRAFGLPLVGTDVSLFGFNPQCRDPNTASGIYVHKLARGSALFATFRLWSQWGPEGPLFGVFHGDLCGRGAARFLEMSPSTTATVLFAPTSGGGFELLGAQPGEIVGQVRIADSSLPLYTNCVEQALPAQVPTAVAYSIVHNSMPSVMDAVPITVQLQRGYVTTAVDEYTPTRIRLKVCGTGSHVRVEGGILHLVPMDSADASFTVQDGLYPVPPGSRHVAIIQDLRPGGHTRRVILQAGADGSIVISGTFVAHCITIEPAAQQQSAPAPGPG